MNKIYKIIRSRKNGLTMVVSELAKGNKKSLTGKLLALAVGATVLSATTAMATTIDITENNQVISDHYDSTSGDPLKINFNDPNYTLIFKDISTTGAIKSTDNNITLQVNGDSLKAGGNLIFKNNQSDSNGGAIFIAVKGNIILDISSLNSIRFEGNKTNSPRGGGIFSYSVTLGNEATFIGNIAGNNGVGYGGGIYSTSSTSNTSSIILGNNTTFINNIAGNSGNKGSGGAIFSSAYPNSFSSASSSVILGNEATFSGNIAGNSGFGYGGGILSDSNQDSTSSDPGSNTSSVTLGHNATFTRNIAGKNGFGAGGGIYSNSINNSSNSSSVTLDNNATFTGNIAGNNGYGYGGGFILILTIFLP